MEIDTNLVVVDVVTTWTVDAGLFLIAGLGFLVWSIALSGVWRSLAAFAIEVIVALAFERAFTTLHRADRLKGASPLPAGARSGSMLAYTLKGMCAVGVTCAVTPKPEAPAGYDPEAEKAVQAITDQIMAQVDPL